MNASLNKMLENVKWGEFKLGDLFQICGTNSFNSDDLTQGTDYDYVTRTSLNQGILSTTGFINSESLNSSGVWSLGLLQMDFFYRNRKWYAGQFVRKIVPRISIPFNTISFFTTILNSLKPILLSVLVRNVDETFSNLHIKLPILDNKEIDFKFMETFIAELKAERVAELKAERVAELSAYLKASGLDNYELSDADLQAIHEFESLTCNDWSEFKIGELFDRVKTIKLPYKADDLPKQPTGNYTLPCLTSSFQNQGLNYYAPIENATVLSNVISLPSNSDVYRAYYQPNDFTVLSDAYAIRWKKDDIIELSPEQYIFMVMCINKVTDLPIYSYKNKLGGWNIVKGKYIQLPVKNGVINFDLMGKYINALKKLAIKEVAVYTEKEEQAFLSVSD